MYLPVLPFFALEPAPHTLAWALAEQGQISE